MFNPGFYDQGDNEFASPMGFFQPGMPRGSQPRIFDEYYRCYPVAMLPGPDRDNVSHGGKVFMPPSALDRLSRLHITYPMLFELINGATKRKTHAGVLEFIAEEGKIYLPYWMMQVLCLDPGDLVQIKSTNLPPGTYIKVQPQSPDFLDISDPKAVLENAFRNFACLTQGDIFTFSYNDTVYEIAVLDTKPTNSAKAISVIETDLEVDFATPIGYQEPARQPPTSRSTDTATSKFPHPHPSSTGANQNTMATKIGYAAIAPQSAQMSASTPTNRTDNFTSEGHRLKPTRKKTVPASASSNPTAPITIPHTTTGQLTPQPLRLPEGTLFFGYEIKPVPAKPKTTDDTSKENPKHHFSGKGQSLRAKKDRDMSNES